MARTRTRRVLILQHVRWESPGRLLPALADAGTEADVRILRGADAGTVPSLDELAGVVIMGGPMGADDVAQHPALAIERDLARRAFEADVPLLGVCLGHQILTLALGGSLRPGETTEIGVAPVTLLADSSLGSKGTSLEVLHWHSDNAVPPRGADVLARSDGCPNQAFRLGSAFGMQFHLEVDPLQLAQWLEVEEVRDEAGGASEGMLERLREVDATLAGVAEAVFGEFATRALERT